MKFAAAILLILPAILPAQPIAIGEYPMPIDGISTSGITTGPDGALWFTGWRSPDGMIGRITTAGAVTLYDLGANTSPKGITKGPDGAVWFTLGYFNQPIGQIGRISTSGTIALYSLPSGAFAWDIMASDGALWFTDSGNNKIGRMSTAGHVTEFPIPSANSGLGGISKGPDGALWFCEARANNIGRITTGGAVTEYPIPAPFDPFFIVAGSDDGLWFSGAASNAPNIGRITTAGAITLYPLPEHYTDVWGITATSDGSLWYTQTNTEYAGGALGQVTTSGAITEYPVPAGTNIQTLPASITTRPGGELWFTDNMTDRIGQAVFPTANLSVTPASGVLKSSLTFTGNGFAGGETVRIYSLGVGSAVLASGTADGSGSFTAAAPAPASPYGPRIFLGKGETSGKLGAADFAMMPRLILSPGAGAAGSTVTVEGYGYAPSDVATIYWDTPRTKLGIATCDAHGSFSGSNAFTFTVPEGVSARKNGVFGVSGWTETIGSSSFTVQ